MITTGHTDQDVKDVIQNIRQRDIDESSLMYPTWSAAALIEDSAATSELTFTFKVPGFDVCAGIGGVFNHPDVPGYLVWFVGTTQIDGNLSVQKLLYTEALEFMPTLMHKYKRLCNYCMEDGKMERLLTRLGFTIYPATSDLRFFQCVL